MIEAALLGQVIEAVGATEVVARVDTLALAADLRQRFAGVRFTVCNDEDIPARLEPAAGNALCNLYYVNATEHCLKLTSDAESASGIVVAFRDDN